MAAYCAASSSWRKAKPTVRNSAKISNPSKVQPRFEAISTFHCARLSERYHGRRRADSWIDIDAPSPVHPRPSQREAIGRFQREYRERRRSAATDAKRLSRSVRRASAISNKIPAKAGMHLADALALAGISPGLRRDLKRTRHWGLVSRD